MTPCTPPDDRRVVPTADAGPGPAGPDSPAPASGASGADAPHRLAPLVAAAVLLVGLAASTAVYATARRDAADFLAQRMDRVTWIAHHEIQDQAERYGSAARLLAASLSRDRPTAADFETASRPLTGGGLSGVAAVYYVVPATDAQVVGAQADWRARGAAGTHLLPNGHTEHLFTVLGRALDGRPTVLSGLDLNQRPEIVAALLAARRTGELVASEPYHPLLDRALPAATQQMAVTLAAPVRTPTGATQGWVMLVVRGQDLADTSVGRIDQRAFGIQLTAPVTGTAPARLATLSARHDPDRSRDVPVVVADRSWGLRVTAATRDLAARPGVPTLYAVSSVALTLLLTLLVWLLATARARAQSRVRTATTELRAQTELLEAIIDAATEGVSVWTDDGTLLLHNAAAAAQMGVEPLQGTPEDATGHYGVFLADRVTPCPAARLPVALARTGQPVTDVEYFLRDEVHPGGLVLTATCRRIRLTEGRHAIVLITRDVSADRARESDLVAFAGMVAHDLKAPLSAISGFAEVLAGRLATGTIDPAVLGRTVDRIHDTGRQMITLVNDLLDHAMARDAVPDRRRVDLGELLAAVLDQRIGHLGGANEPGPEVYIGDLPPVVGDPALLRRLLDNLLGNALTYTRPGRPAHIDVTARTVRGSWVRVDVADRGLGIPDADKQRAFQPFQRLGGERDHSGTGLGLAICRRIVERHGGAITVVDNAGGGARFQFTLPAAGPGVTTPARAAPASRGGADAPGAGPPARGAVPQQQ